MAEIQQKTATVEPAEKASLTWEERGLKIVKSEALRVFLLIIFLIVLVVYALPFFFDNSALKSQISRKISQISGATFIIRGDVKVGLLPSPTITINDVLLQNYKPKVTENQTQRTYNIYARSVEIKFPIFKFSEEEIFKKITIFDPVFEGYVTSNEAIERQNKLTSIIADFTKSPLTKEANLGSGVSEKFFSISEIDAGELKTGSAPDIIVENGEGVIYDRFSRIKELKAINFELEVSAKKTVAEGSFSSEDILSNFKFLAKFNSQANSPDSTLDIISPVMQLHASGNFTSENRGILSTDFKGKVEMEILELKSFYRSYISGMGVIPNKLKYSAQPLKITADIQNISREININNLTINSTLASGAGDINLNFADKIPLIDINLNLENLDLDNIWSNEAIAVAMDERGESEQSNIANDEAEFVSQQPVVAAPEALPDQAAPAEIEKTEKIEPINFKLAEKIKNFDLSAEIKVKSAKYLEGEIKDTVLYLTVSKAGEIMVLPMIFRIPGEGIFRVNGVLDNSTIVPKFVGKFDASGKSLKDVFKWLKIESQNLKFDNLREYNLYSDILLLPNSIAMNNFYLNLNNGASEFLGELKIDNAGNVANIISRFQISEFNVDDYFLTSGQNIYFSPGSLLKKLLWLNDIGSNNDLTLRFEKMIYKKEEFPEQSMKLRFGRGYFEISDLNLKSDKTNLKASLAVDISDKNPKFEIKVDADNFHYETLDKTTVVAGDSRDSSIFKAPKNHNFFDQFYALPSLEGFGGKVALNFNDLNIDGTQIKNAKISGKMKDGNIDVSEMALDIYGGNLTYKGLLGIKMTKTINGNLTLTNASLQPLLSDAMGINNISGVANISASITALANVKEDFTKQLTSEIKINANAPSISGYGLNDLVKKMFMPQNYAAELRNPENILLNPQSVTTFKQANGTIQLINGKEGKMRINVSAPAMNGILSGTISGENKTVDALFNVIFLTGNRNKQTPINIATNLKGSFGAISQSTNLDQARQFLGLSVKKTATAVEAAPPALTQENQVPEQAAPLGNYPTIQQVPAPDRSRLIQQAPVQQQPQVMYQAPPPTQYGPPPTQAQPAQQPATQQPAPAQ